MYRGKLKKVEFKDGQDIQDFCYDKIMELKSNNKKFKLNTRMYKDNLQFLTDEHYDKYMLVDGELYEFLKCDKVSSQKIFDINKNEDGTLDFLVGFHEGGTSLNEVLNEIVPEAEAKT